MENWYRMISMVWRCQSSGMSWYPTGFCIGYINTQVFRRHGPVRTVGPVSFDLVDMSRLHCVPVHVEQRARINDALWNWVQVMHAATAMWNSTSQDISGVGISFSFVISACYFIAHLRHPVPVQIRAFTWVRRELVLLGDLCLLQVLSDL